MFKLLRYWKPITLLVITGYTQRHKIKDYIVGKYEKHMLDMEIRSYLRDQGYAVENVEYNHIRQQYEYTAKNPDGEFEQGVVQVEDGNLAHYVKRGHENE